MRFGHVQYIPHCTMVLKIKFLSFKIKLQKYAVYKKYKMNFKVIHILCVDMEGYEE